MKHTVQTPSLCQSPDGRFQRLPACHGPYKKVSHTSWTTWVVCGTGASPVLGIVSAKGPANGDHFWSDQRSQRSVGSPHTNEPARPTELPGYYDCRLEQSTTSELFGSSRRHSNWKNWAKGFHPTQKRQTSLQSTEGLEVENPAVHPQSTHPRFWHSCRRLPRADATLPQTNSEQLLFQLSVAPKLPKKPQGVWGSPTLLPGQLFCCSKSSKRPVYTWL